MTFLTLILHRIGNKGDPLLFFIPTEPNTDTEKDGQSTKSLRSERVKYIYLNRNNQ